MKMELVGTAQSGKTEVDIGIKWRTAADSQLLTACLNAAMDEDKPTPEWTQGVKVELD